MGKPFLSDPTNQAIGAGACFFVATFSIHALQPGSHSWLTPKVAAAMGLILYGVGFALLLSSLVAAWRNRDSRLAWLAFLAFALGGAMAGVVQKEPQNFFGVGAGVFASLMLAMVASNLGPRPPEGRPFKARVKERQATDNLATRATQRVSVISSRFSPSRRSGHPIRDVLSPGFPPSTTGLLGTAVTEIGVFAAIFLSLTAMRTEPLQWAPTYWFMAFFLAGLIIASFLWMALHWPSGISRSLMVTCYKFALAIFLASNLAVPVYFFSWWVHIS